MSAEVVHLRTDTVPAVLAAATAENLRGVAVIGIDEDGETYLDAAGLECAELVFLLERLKARIIG